MPSYYVGFTATPKSLTEVKFKKWRNTIYLLTTEYRTANLDDVIAFLDHLLAPLRNVQIVTRMMERVRVEEGKEKEKELRRVWLEAKALRGDLKDVTEKVHSLLPRLTATLERATLPAPLGQL